MKNIPGYITYPDSLFFRFIHKYQLNRNKGDELRLRHHQRRFLNAIGAFRHIKWEQRKLQEKGNSLIDVGKVVHTLSFIL